MSKIIRLSESQLREIITKIISEQSVSGVNQPKSNTSNSSVAMKNNSQNSQDWYKNFPCLNKKNKGLSVRNGMWVTNNRILLPQTGKNDKSYDKAFDVYKPYKNYVGQIQGGGVYFCSADFPEGIITL